ncbi:MAG: hypothetical protein ABI851_08855 [Saprospiraceae bacterium]
MKRFFTIGFLLLTLINLNSQQSFDIKFMLEGHLREYIIVKPSKVLPSGSYPVVFMLHGTSGDGEKFFNISEWKELGEEENYISIYPSALSWSYIEDREEKFRTRWVEASLKPILCSGPPQNYLDDVKFLKLIIQIISDLLPVNKSLIFAS